MTRALSIGLLAALLIGGLPARAAADLTAFWGASPTPSTRSARGLALGVGLVIVGFEFEYANTSEGDTNQVPGLRTGMFNGLLQTPTRIQLYATAGGGFYREQSNEDSETHFGTNAGGGIKIPLFGPLRLRLDYRVFSLRGSPAYKNPQRFYGGVNLSF